MGHRVCVHCVPIGPRWPLNITMCDGISVHQGINLSLASIWFSLFYFWFGASFMEPTKKKSCLDKRGSRVPPGNYFLTSTYASADPYLCWSLNTIPKSTKGKTKNKILSFPYMLDLTSTAADLDALHSQAVSILWKEQVTRYFPVANTGKISYWT